MRRPTAAILLLILPGPAASALDCARPETPSEAAVCGSGRLAHLEGIVEERYRSILGALESGAADAVRRGQRDWLAARDGCGEDRDCLEAAYRRRLRALGL